jgi:hypothetical protein
MTPPVGGATPPPIPRDPSVGYCLTAPLPFIVAPAVLAFRGWDWWLVLLAGFGAGFAGFLIGSLLAFLILEHSSAARRVLGDVAISLAGTIAAFLLALLIPLPQ